MRPPSVLLHRAKLAAMLVVPLFVLVSLSSGSSGTSSPAPDRPVSQRVSDMKIAGHDFPLVALFGDAAQSAQVDRRTHDALDNGVILSLNTEATAGVLRDHPATIRFRLPSPGGTGDVDLELVRTEILATDFTVVSSTDGTVPYQPGVYYRGIVAGRPGSLAAISVFGNEVMGFFSTAEDGNVVVGKLNGRQEHVLYRDRDLKSPLQFVCETVDDLTGIDAKDLEPNATSPLARCVRIYVETDYDIYQNKGSVTNVSNYITGMFNQSATLYANESIPISLSQLFVWSSTSPYTGSSSSTLLSQFQSYRNSFNGDLGHLLAFRGGGGIAAGFNGFCNSNPDNKQCFSGIDPTYNSVPTYSWTVEVFTHEMGHLMGSRHTHACVWNGNNTAIDGCYTTEGGCPRPGLPSGGGTIMSYCHLTSVGINFNNGFGPQPGNVIRNGFASASCLVDCGGGGCTYSIAPSGASFSSGGGTGSISVSAGSGCSWTATSNASFISVTGGASGSGNGTVSYSVAANTGGQRTGTITAAGNAFTVSQAAASGGCTGTLYAGSLSGTGASQYQPNGTYYYSSVSGTHHGVLTGPAGTDFDLYLYRWSGSRWVVVAQGLSATPNEDVSYNGSAGYYTWRVYSYRGSGSYTLCLTSPGSAAGIVASGNETLSMPSETVAEKTEPDGARLDQNNPNPFNPTTRISYFIPTAMPVRLDVYNILGERVATLVDSQEDAGTHTVEFGTGNLGSGVYVYRLTAGNTTTTRRMILMK